MKEVHDVVNFTVDGSERSAAMVVVRVFLVVFLVSEVTISFVAAVFNWGGHLSFRGHFEFSRGKPLCCHEKIEAFLRSNSVALQEI